MKSITIRISKSISILFIGVILFSSCEGILAPKSEQQTVKAVSIDDKDFIGSWRDSSVMGTNFTLFEDGTARSDNMKTVLYKEWRTVGNEITFTIESVVNGRSSSEKETYTIEKLTKNRMVLSKNGKLTEYIKK